MRRIKAYTGLGLFLTLALAIASGCGTNGETGKWLDGSRAPAPTVSFTLPLNLAVNVATNTLLTATFSEEMDPESINTTTFTLMNGSEVILGTVGYAGVTAVFTPAVALSDSTTYTATITVGAKSRAYGTNLDNNYVWTFTTATPGGDIPPDITPPIPGPNPGPSPDLRAPRVTSTVPANLATEVAINTSIIATFSEAMNPLSLTTASFTVKKGLVTVPGTVLPVGLTAVFTPNAPLDSSAVYTATITTVAEDLAGNNLAANYVWTFTTGALVDIIPPTVILTAPLNGATGVAINTNVVATFSEAMAPLSLTPLTFTLHKGLVSIGHTVLPLLDVATLNPSANLEYDTLYTATVTVGAKDLANNAMVAPYVWTFRTAAAPPVLFNLGILAPYGIASAGGVTTGAAPVKINGSTVLDPLDQCNAVAVGAADDFGLCGGNPPLNNLPGVRDFVITPTHSAPGPVTAAAVKATLLTKWGNLSPAGHPGGTVLGCGTIGSAGGAGALIGCNGNFTLPPGVYISQTSSSIGVAGSLVLDGGGDANATFIFQAPSSLTTAPNTTITLQNGTKASNVWWYVGSSATLGSNTAFKGNILASAAISMGTTATSCGRLLSGASGAGAFTFLGNTVSVPGHPNAPAGCN
ncbi:MAG: Ig-like domain-containing protein [Nitrospinae bacterium]|nr:Ig-like domain-containing protein [Nitrospinota bacterium]